MNAIISGRSGRALLIDGNSLKSFEVYDPSTLTSRQQADLPYLFGEGSDLRILEDTTIEDVELELRNNCNFTWALDLTLISLDAELPTDIRTDAVVNLEKILETKETLLQVENVLYAQPLPEDADVNGALSICSLTALNTAHKFLSNLEKFQPRISDVRRAWESIPTKFFDNYEARDTFRSVAVTAGRFRILAKGFSKSTVDFQRESDNSSLKKLPNHNQILRKWFELSYGVTFEAVNRVSQVVARARMGSRVHELRLAPNKRNMILQILRKTHGNYVLAAKLLGVSPRYLRKLLAKSKYERPKLNV